jgi:hypothetical protein
MLRSWERSWWPDFAVAIVSSAFASKTAIQRHRMVNSLLKDEFDNMGLHALSLRLKTPEEWEKEVDVASAKMGVWLAQERYAGKIGKYM